MLGKFEGEKTLTLIYDWIVEDTTQSDIALMLHISRSTWYEWKKMYPDINDVIKKAEEDSKEVIRNAARISLLKRIRGYTATETKKVNVLRKDPITLREVMVTKEETITEKVFPPSDMLIMYALNNRDADNYANRSKIDVSETEADFEPTTPEQDELLKKLNDSVKPMNI